MRILRNIAGGVILIVFVFAVREVFLWDTHPAVELDYPSGEVSLAPTGTSPISSDTESSCADLSIVYDIGDMDVRFGISREEFASAIKEAEAIWESAIKRDIFIINSADYNRMKINLVFDERQAKTLELKQKIAGINSERTRYDIVKNEHQILSNQISHASQEINILKNRHEAAHDSLSLQITALNKRALLYDEQVANWNRQGGAPSPEYERLIAESNEINSLSKQIEAERIELIALGNNLNQKVDSYNALVAQINVVAGILNNLAESLNYNVAIHNRLVGERGEFVTGSYTSNGEKFINIYQFYDRRELVIIIAHELGHALGLSHATQNDSIMYHRVARQELKLSGEDLLLINKICE